MAAFLGKENTILQLKESPQNSVEVQNKALACFRRVHISEDTLNCLNDVYDVEPGNGIDRDNYLKERNVVTYLIKQLEPMKCRRRYSSRPKIWSEDDAKQGKKSFKLSNPLAANSSAPNSSTDDEIGVDWTPEIPFENVRFFLAADT